MFHHCKHWPIIWPSSSEPTNGARQWNLLIIVMTADGWCAFWCNKGHNHRSKSNLYLHKNLDHGWESLPTRRMTSLFFGTVVHLGQDSQKCKKKGQLQLTRVSKYAVQIYINIFQHEQTCREGRARHRYFNQLDLRCLYLVWTSQPGICINYPIRPEDGWRGARRSANLKPIWDLESPKLPLIEKVFYPKAPGMVWGVEPPF